MVTLLKRKRRSVIGISRSLIWSKTLMELIINSCGEFRWVRRAQLAKSTLLTSTSVPLRSFQIFLRSAQMLKREWGAESKGKLPHLFIPSKTVTLVPEFAVEDLRLGWTAALVPEFTLKDLALGRTLYDEGWESLCINFNYCFYFI